MKFKYHFTIGFLASIALFFTLNLKVSQALIIFLSSWLIDIDHYVWYTIRYRDLNPINAMKRYFYLRKNFETLSPKQKEKYEKGIFIFHSIPLLILIAALSFFYEIFFFILIGFIIHMTLDHIDLALNKKTHLHKIFPLYTIKTNKNKKPLPLPCQKN